MLTRQECVQKMLTQLPEIQNKLLLLVYGTGFISDMIKAENDLQIVAIIMFCFGYKSEYELWKNTSKIPNDEERANTLITVCESFLSSLKREVQIKI